MPFGECANHLMSGVAFHPGSLICMFVISLAYILLCCALEIYSFISVPSFKILTPSTVLWYCSRPNIEENVLVRNEHNDGDVISNLPLKTVFSSFKYLVDILPCFLLALHHPSLDLSHLLTGLLDSNQNHPV